MPNTRNLLVIFLLVMLTHCTQASAQSFIEELFNDNAFRRAQNNISQYTSGARQASQRGTLSGYIAYRSGYNGYLGGKRSEAGRRELFARELAIGRVQTPVSHLRTYNPTPSVPRQQGFQTGHQSGFMYTSRFYGRGPK